MEVSSLTFAVITRQGHEFEDDIEGCNEAKVGGG